MKRFLGVLTVLMVLTVLVYPAGRPETSSREAEYRNFTALEISGGYTFQIRQASEWAVRLWVAPRYESRVRIVQKGETLEVSVRPEPFDWLAKPEDLAVEILTPQIKSVKISGASKGSLLFDASESKELELSLSGASQVEANLIARDLRVSLSGASRLHGRLALASVRGELEGSSNFNARLEAKSTEFRLEGATELSLKGTSPQARFVVSGASRAYGRDFITQNTRVDAEGASQVELNATQSVEAFASGASAVQWWGPASLGHSRESGASFIRKMD